MAITHNLGITLLEQAQAQKEVTINQAIAVLDAAFNLSVLDKDLATPPASPAAGDSYLIASAPTGAWAGKANYVTYYDSGWRFIAPKEGLTIWVADETAEYRYSGSAWAIVSSGGGGGSGDVVGPASSADNTLARFDGTTGKLIQGCGIVVDDSNNVTGVGTLAAGAQVLTSAAAQALVVGANGATNPAFTVDASTASSATGVSVKSAAAGAGASITATSSGTNESITIAAKGTGTATLNGGASAALTIGGSSVVSATATTIMLTNTARSFTSNSGMLYTLPAGSSLTASAESTGILLNLSSTQTHATGAISLQRDMRIRPSTHGFSAASTITDAAGLAIDGASIAGTNATLTNSSTLYSAGNAVGAGTTNSYGLNITANTGATNNFAARFAGAAGEILRLRTDGQVALLATNTAAGNTGAQTINRPSGTVNFAAGSSSLVVTNSLCTTASLVFATVRTNDATAVIKNVVPAAGSFTINLNAAATAETSVGFFIIN